MRNTVKHFAAEWSQIPQNAAKEGVLLLHLECLLTVIRYNTH